MDIDKVLEGVNFDNVKQKELVEGAVELELRKIVDDPQNTIDFLEKLVLTAFQQIMPFFHMLLDLKALSYFADLKGSFDYIVNCQKEKVPRPFPELEHYSTLCELTSYALDSSYLEDCPKDLRRKMKQFCTAYYKELKHTNQETQGIAESCDWQIFENYFYLLQYFKNTCFGNDYDEDRKRIANCCQEWLYNILFYVLWDLDEYLGHTVDESYFKQAMKNIFIQNKDRTDE